MLEQIIAVGIMKESAGKGAAIGAVVGGLGLGASMYKAAGKVYANPDDPSFEMGQAQRDQIKSNLKKLSPDQIKIAQKFVGGASGVVGAVGGGGVGAGMGALYGKMKGSSRKPVGATA